MAKSSRVEKLMIKGMQKDIKSAKGVMILLSIVLFANAAFGIFYSIDASNISEGQATFLQYMSIIYGVVAIGYLYLIHLIDQKPAKSVGIGFAVYVILLILRIILNPLSFLSMGNVFSAIFVFTFIWALKSAKRYEKKKAEMDSKTDE